MKPSTLIPIIGIPILTIILGVFIILMFEDEGETLKWNALTVDYMFLDMIWKMPKNVYEKCRRKWNEGWIIPNQIG